MEFFFGGGGARIVERKNDLHMSPQITISLWKRVVGHQKRIHVQTYR